MRVRFPSPAPNSPINDTTGELRRVFPALVAVAEPYLGKSTEKQVEVRIRENDGRIKAIKGNE